MKLTHLSISNYRSIVDAEKLALGDLTVLVGPNNEGKSNILQALVTGVQILSGRREPMGARVRFHSRIGNYDWKRDYPRALQETKPGGKSIFSFDFQLDSTEIAEFERVVGSRLNGILPISLSFGADGLATFAVRKQRHSAALSAKRPEIAEFLGQRLQVQYIPAARTSDASLRVVSAMVNDILRTAEQNPEYVAAMERVQEIQTPLLEELAESVRETLQQFIPTVRNVVMTTEDRGPSMRPDVRLIIDDGTPTDLEFKGDGIQSLAALALTRHHADVRSTGDVILAVEEPEAHLHPKAIHQVRDVLYAIAEKQQVVIATHSPLLVNRFDPRSNVVVEKTRATPAKSLSHLRSVLGVRVSDNLAHAEVVLVVEGPEDERALHPILAAQSSALESALANGSLALKPLWGGAKLPYELSMLQLSVCQAHVLLDDDAAGRASHKQAVAEALVMPADVCFARYPGAKESEFEDMLDPEVYRDAVWASHGLNVDDLTAIPRSKGKWTTRVRLVFNSRGLAWSDHEETKLKRVVADAAAADPANAINQNSITVVSGLIASLEAKLDALRHTPAKT